MFFIEGESMGPFLLLEGRVRVLNYANCGSKWGRGILTGSFLKWNCKDYSGMHEKGKCKDFFGQSKFKKQYIKYTALSHCDKFGHMLILCY